MLRAFIKNAEFGISLLFIFVAICLAYIAVPAFGNKALIVRSGSMEPTVKVGDLVVVQTQHSIFSPLPIRANPFSSALIGSYKEGDIIAFKDSKSPKILITHRIIGKEIKDGKIYYQTQGDANNAKDTNLISEENIVGKAIFSVAGIGKLFAFAKSKYGFGLMIVFPALMVIVFEIVNIIREVRRIRRKSTESTSPVILPSSPVILERSDRISVPDSSVVPMGGVALRVLIPLALSIFVIHNSLAYFSDTGTSTNNVFTATENFGPGPGDVVINELMWMGSSKGASDEWIELRNMTGNSIDISGWQLTKWVTSGTDHEELMLTIPASSSIPANGLFLIAQFPSGDPGSALNVTPNVVSTSVTLSNTALQVRLFVSNWDSSGTLIDTAGDQSAPLAGAHKTSTPKQFYSMERNSTPSDGTSATNWHTAATSVGFDTGEDVENRGTPKSANSS